MKGKLKRYSLILLAFMMFNTTPAYAMDVPFYSANHIYYYDDSDTSCAVDSSGNAPISYVAGNDNAEKIFNFLTSSNFKATGGKPFNAVQAAGALGNFYQESGYRFNAIQGGRSEVSETSRASGIGYGIAQWDGDRRVTLLKKAAEMNKSWKEPEVQFKMISDELNDVDSNEGTRLLTEFGGEFQTVTDPARASFLFMRIYERAGKPNQAKRDDEAKRMYEKYKDRAPGPTIDLTNISTTAKQQACVSNAVFHGNSDKSLASEITSDGYVVYLQNDSKWKSSPYGSSTVGIAGCGPTTFAMIYTALTGKSINPAETAKISADNRQFIPGVGSSSAFSQVLARHYGLSHRQIKRTEAEINQALRNGEYVIISGRGTEPYYSGIGHIIHIRGITSDGKWKIGDSGKRGTSDKTYEPSKIVSMSNYWVFAIGKGGNSV